MGTFIVDSREKTRAITKIVAEFDKQGIKHITSKLPFGDYMNMDNPKIYIDRKQNLLELCGNVGQQHDRFRRELELCRDCGCHMIILCEHGGAIKQMSDVESWINPRIKAGHSCAMSGERLYRIMKTMSSTYGVEFLFCDKRNTGKRIIELLGGNDGTA